MKVASKMVLLVNDPQGFSSSIFYSLQSDGPHSSFRRLDEKFQLSLEQYGIKDQRGVVILLILLTTKAGCRSIEGESVSSTRTLVLPYILPAASLKCEDKSSSVDSKNASLYGIHLGQVTDFSQDIIRTAEKPPLSLQIRYEPLACLLQFFHVLNFPTALLIGKQGTREEHEVLHEMGKLLASAFGLCFEKERMKLDLGKTTIVKEPWRALYG